MNRLARHWIVPPVLLACCLLQNDGGSIPLQEIPPIMADFQGPRPGMKAITDPGNRPVDEDAPATRSTGEPVPADSFFLQTQSSREPAAAVPAFSVIPAKDKAAAMIPRESGQILPENRLPENSYPDLEKTRFRSLDNFTVPPHAGALVPVLLPSPTSSASLAPLTPTGRGRAADPMEIPERPGNDSFPGGPGGEILPTVRLVPTSSPVREGDSVILEVRIDAAAGIRSAPFHLLYPADLVEFEDGNPESFLGKEEDLLFLADGAPGRLFVALTAMTPGEGRSGSGKLCRLRFRAMRSGVAAFRFEDAHLFASHQQEIRGRFMPGNVEIIPALTEPPES